MIKNIKRSSLLLLLSLTLFVVSCGPSFSDDVAVTTEPTKDSTVVEDHATAVATTSSSAGNPDTTTDPVDGTLMQWDASPEMVIDSNKYYVATLKTNKGDIVVELNAKAAPVTVNNFVFLAREGYYDNTTFHRVIPDFMAQAGDPTGTGMGGPGYQFEDEVSSGIKFDRAGLLAMANAGPGTNGSQFFITYAETPWLDGRHTIFGQVVEGLDIALSLEERDPQSSQTAGDQLISVVIEEKSVSLLPEPTATPLPIVPAMEDGRPLAALPVAEREGLFDGPPAMMIDMSKSYEATFVTSKGTFVAMLDAAAAPNSVNNFYVLANLGYWDNFPIIFADSSNDVVVAITGSPAGSPNSDVGYELGLETELLNLAGAVGFWRVSATGVSGSQIYFLGTDYPALDQNAAVFGMITDGLDIIPTLVMGEDMIESVTVVEK